MEQDATKRPKPNAGGRRGWLLTAFFAPQLVAGAWLVVVPDHLAFTANQIVTLAHVAFGLVTLPIGAWLLRRHARETRLRNRSTGADWNRRIVALATVVAVASGVAALWSGEGMPAARLHAVLGLLVALPLAVHIHGSGRQLAGLALGLVAPAAGLLGALATATLPPKPIEAEIPEFTYALRDVEAYESAAWCGSCHVELFEEWKRSSHARTFEFPRLREDFDRTRDLSRGDLAVFGRMAAGEPVPHSKDPEPIRQIENCVHCHAPASFYGRDDRDVLDDPSPQAADAVSCSFCHTLRGVREPQPMPARFAEKLAATPAPLDRWQQKLGPLTDAESVPRMTLYVSAPETVRRYLGQGGDGLARWIGDLLIRWRPDVHRHDYKSDVLTTSAACKACHGISDDLWTMPHQEYATWATSRFNTGPAGSVECQDCHMEERPADVPQQHPGRLVPWGPERPRRRSHLFLGGNVQAFLERKDADMAKREHVFNTFAAKVRIEAAHVDDDTLRARVVVTNWLTGHLFPAGEQGFRPAWLRLSAIDAKGATLGATQGPRNGNDTSADDHVMLRRVNRAENEVTFDTTLFPDESRRFELSLPLPPGTAPASVTVDLLHAFDPEPVASASTPLAAPVD